jgi:hypothetical protein
MKRIFYLYPTASASVARNRNKLATLRVGIGLVFERQMKPARISALAIISS